LVSQGWTHPGGRTVSRPDGYRAFWVTVMVKPVEPPVTVVRPGMTSGPLTPMGPKGEERARPVVLGRIW